MARCELCGKTGSVEKLLAHGKKDHKKSSKDVAKERKLHNGKRG